MSGRRVAMVVLNLEVGGLERIVADLALCLQRRGNEVCVVALRGGGPIGEALVDRGVVVEQLGLGDGLRPANFRVVGEALARLRPDVVHSHGEAALCYVGIPARLRRDFRHVHTRHGYEDVSFRGRLRNRLAHGGCDAVVCVSEDLARHCLEVERVPAGRLSTIVNGVDLTPYRCLPLAEHRDRAPVIGHVARLVEIKNQRLLLRAFAALQRDWPEARLEIIGDGPERAALCVLAGELGVTDQVRFHGEVSDVCARLAPAHLFCLSSDSEGTPVSVLEALSAGRPVVSTDVGGIRDVVPERGGRLVPAGDARALSDALRSIYADPSDFGEAVAAARSAPLNDVEAMAEAYLRVYESA
ncbi:MAG: glycosyltransferase [Pseudomonadota bacterium]